MISRRLLGAVIVLAIGGGVTNTFPEITVHRFGAINVRTAIAYVRDVVWAELDATNAVLD